MPEIIAPTTAAVLKEEVITTQHINQVLRATGPLGAYVIPIETQNPDDSWSQMSVEINGVTTLIQLDADNMAIGIYAAMGRIRINKPATGAVPIGVWLGA